MMKQTRPDAVIQTLPIQGHALRVDFQPGRGTPLVLCNGWGANIETWDPLMEHLGPRPVLRFDVPGIGGSEQPLIPLRLPRLASMLEDVLRHFDLTQVDVAGYSWGGALAQELARRNPKSVRRLILMATSPGHLMAPASPRILLAFANHRWLSSLLRPSRFFERDFMCSVGPRLFGGDVLRRNPMALLPNLRQLRQPSTRAMLWQAAGALGWSSLPWLGRLNQPVLILAGRDDRVINPLNPLILKRLIPDARLHWLDGGHLFPVLDAPAVTARYISEFLDENPKVIPLAGRRKRPARRAL